MRLYVTLLLVAALLVISQAKPAKKALKQKKEAKDALAHRLRSLAALKKKSLQKKELAKKFFSSYSFDFSSDSDSSSPWSWSSGSSDLSSSSSSSSSDGGYSSESWSGSSGSSDSFSYGDWSLDFSYSASSDFWGNFWECFGWMKKRDLDYDGAEDDFWHCLMGKPDDRPDDKQDSRPDDKHASRPGDKVDQRPGKDDSKTKRGHNASKQQNRRRALLNALKQH